MATIVTRSGKGSPLTNTEVDANFTNLNNDKLETNAEVRAAVEAASDSNVFTDADHTKLNGVAASANNYSHPTGNGNNHIPSGGSSGQILGYASAGTAQWQAPSLADNAVTTAKIENNAVTQAKIGGEAINEARLQVSNAPSNGYFLSAQSGNTGGLTWAAAASGADLYTANESSPDAQPSATGTNAVAIGDSSEASGTRSTALGKGIAAAIESAAIGPAYAGGASSFAAGISTNGNSYGATSSGAIALGQNAKASYFRATAIGEYAIASGNRATAIGRSATSAGTYGFAGGGQSRADGDYSVALGQSFANGENSFAAGIGVTNGSKGAMNINSVAIGQNANAGWNNSLAIGISATTGAANQIALGGTSNQVKISGTYTLPTSDGSANQVLTTNGSGAVSFADAGGGGASASADLYIANPSSATSPTAAGTNAVAIGNNATASAEISTAIGDDAVASDYAAISIGENSVASGYRSISLGTFTDATADYAAAIGAGAQAIGAKAVAIYGEARHERTTAIGQGSNTNVAIAGIVGTQSGGAVAIGNAFAGGVDSLAAAITNNTNSYGATGASSVAMGPNAIASGYGSLSLGKQNTASASYSTVVGSYVSTASANYSGVFGGRTNTASSTYATVVGGTTNVASGQFSAVIGGLGNTASGEYGIAMGESSTASHANSVSIGNNVQSTATNQINLGGTADTVRISEGYTLPTSDGSANQVLTTNGSGAVSFADAGGGASASTVVTKPDAYTVGSSDLGYILIFTGSWNEYATLGSAATLGSGFYVTIINQSGSTHTINRTGSDTFMNNGSVGDTQSKLASGAAVTLVSDGTSKWLSKNISPYLYAECNNNSGNFNPVATGTGAVALGRGANAGGSVSFAAGTNSSYGGSTTNGSGAVALGGSFASGTNSFAAAIANNTSSYGATGANAIAIGNLAKATGEHSIALGKLNIASNHWAFVGGYENTGSGAYSATLGSGNTNSGAANFCVGYGSTADGDYGAAIGRTVSQRDQNHTLAFGLAGQPWTSGSTPDGASQTRITGYAKQTADASPLPMNGYTSNHSVNANNSFTLPNNAAATFSLTVIANVTGGGNSKAWRLEGAVKRGASASATALIGSVIKTTVAEDSGAANWDVSIAANTTIGGWLSHAQAKPAQASAGWVAWTQPKSHIEDS